MGWGKVSKYFVQVGWNSNGDSIFLSLHSSASWIQINLHTECLPSRLSRTAIVGLNPIQTGWARGGVQVTPILFLIFLLV